MGQKYIWEHKNWPNFKWDYAKIIGPLGDARKRQGQLLAKLHHFDVTHQAKLLAGEAHSTSNIEGEKLNDESVRSSVARRLGLSTAGIKKSERETDGLVAMLLDATKNQKTNLSAGRVLAWHKGLFPTGASGLRIIPGGKWRVSAEPMQVVSGRLGRETIHFQAPPSNSVQAEMDLFLDWWNGPSQDLDGIVRAAIAHIWFVTIHPFEDGNGRIARAITDMALAQDENQGIRLYSLSSQIVRARKAYYQILESTQKGNLDITDWILWFIEIFASSVERSLSSISRSVAVSHFWQSDATNNLNSRQIKVLKRLLDDEDGLAGRITNRIYVALTRASRESAKRDLADLESRGLLRKNPGSGRSVSYMLVLNDR